MEEQLVEKGGRKEVRNREMEEAPENGKESSHSAYANGMYELPAQFKNSRVLWKEEQDSFTYLKTFFFCVSGSKIFRNSWFIKAHQKNLRKREEKRKKEQKK